MDYLSWAQGFFAADLYATQTTGIVIEAVEVGYAKCSLSLSEKHQNAAGRAMGGAVFTLADFTFAIAANAGAALTMSLDSQIHFLRGAAIGDSLTAESHCIKSGKNTCVYRVDIKNQEGKDIASVTTTGFRSEGKSK